MFVGFNVAFLPMHLTGLLGMPRRVYTYPAELGWGTLNLRFDRRALSSFARGRADFPDRSRAQFAADIVATAPAMSGRPARSNGWRTIPMRPQHSACHEPRSAVGPAQPRRRRRSGPLLSAGQRRRAGARPSSRRRSRRRRNICCGCRDPAGRPFLAAVFTAAFFLLLTVKLVARAVCGFSPSR